MGDPDDFIVDLRPDAIIIAEQQKKIALYRDIFAEITAKAVPWFAPKSDDPERVRGYKLPVGPIHRAAGDLNFQMFDGERYLSEALATIATLTAALEEARGALEPFAKYADAVAKDHPGWDHDGFSIGLPDALAYPEVDGTLRPFRRARTALATTIAALGRVGG